VPEWASSYIDYKGLKKLIKADARASQSGEKVDLAGKHSDRSTPFLVG
jgi:glycerophosphodiester phosphodiesterase